MAMTWYSGLSRSPELESCNQMQFSLIPKSILWRWGGCLRLWRKYNVWNFTQSLSFISYLCSFFLWDQSWANCSLKAICSSQGFLNSLPKTSIFYRKKGLFTEKKKITNSKVNAIVYGHLLWKWLRYLQHRIYFDFLLKCRWWWAISHVVYFLKNIAHSCFKLIMNQEKINMKENIYKE